MGYVFGDKEGILKQGESVNMPAGLSHTFWNVHPEKRLIQRVSHFSLNSLQHYAFMSAWELVSRYQVSWVVCMVFCLISIMFLHMQAVRLDGPHDWDTKNLKFYIEKDISAS